MLFIQAMAWLPKGQKNVKLLAPVFLFAKL